MKPAPILAHLSTLAAIAPLGADAPAEIMCFPAGVHTIHATQAGEPVTYTVQVGPDTAQAMQAALQAHLAAGQRPYFDFDHEDGPASAWPTGYRWEEGGGEKRAGVYASLDWSASGREAVLGRDYRSFSPSFHVDGGAPSRVVDAPLCMGGLVNSPAFLKQAPIWAKGAPSPSAATPTNETQTTTTMTDEEKKAAEAAAAAAAEAEKKKNEDAAKAASEAAAVAAKKNTALEARIAAIEAKAKAEAEGAAKAAVQAAVNRGALPAKDEAVHAKWVGLIVADPSNADLLAKLPGRDVTQPITAPGFAVEAKAGFVEELRGYSAERDGAKRSAIYAKHIAPMFKQGDFRLGPILAANSLGTLAGDLVTLRAFSLLRHSYPWLFDITTDFSGEQSNFGQTIKTRTKAPLVASPFVPGTGYTRANAGTTDVDVTIDQHIGVPVTFNVNELASTDRDLFGEQAEGMEDALATAIVAHLFGRITAANFVNATAVALPDFKRKSMTAIARKLFERKVGGRGRFVLLNPEYFEQLGNDSTILQLAAYQRPELIEEYRLPRVAGFQPWQAETLPVAEDLVGFAGTPESLAWAARLPNDYTRALPGASNGVVRSVRSPDTGITFQQVDFVDHVKAEATSRAAIMFGTAVGNAATGERITEGAES